MKAFFALAATALAAVPFVAAGTVAPGGSAHFFYLQNESLVFAPADAVAGASLVATIVGDGSATDPTLSTVTAGSGAPTQIAFGGLCVTSAGVTPGTATQTLYVDTCSDDPAQLWTLNTPFEYTISNADGNCITLGKPSEGVPVVLDQCTGELILSQQWNPVSN